MSTSKSRVQETMHRSRVYQHSDGYRLEMVQSIHQRRNKGYTKGIRIRKSRRIEIHWTCSCTNEFNTTFSLCWVLGITLWFSERFSEGRVFCSSRVVSRAFISCFLGHPSILWSFNPQYRQRLLPIWLSQTSFGHISINSHGLNGYGKPLKRPFDQYQSRLEAINNGRDIRQIN